ncbi:MAG: Aldehyde Dehydrogenase [candidate division Zixibacteria bacterium RBG-1]|nr:MAG: Aldehyde Dehydrogenase [candidate division Zixibacteria bacterium RBG-1]OGC83493.1 MAG: betaine-aldehyde dehydrogenase [candidate division Zixibacteria bacterium RBG_19FT_COMBO_42_43]
METLTKEKIQIKPGKLFIGGKWVDSVSGKTFDTINPATGEPITQVYEASEKDVDLAVQAARKAFEEGPWKKMSASDRGKILWKIGDLILKYAAELSYLETLDSGKTIFESSKIDIPHTADVFHYYAGWADKIQGETIPVKGNFFNYTLREPVGVVGQIIPWNFPLSLASWKVAPALACGNTVILKPAEQTPLTALKLGEICQEAGVPDGVINIVTGHGPTTGAAIVKHPGVDKIAFTGSYLTGQEIMRTASNTLKKVSLELGGKSPNIVFADSDIDPAVRGTLNGIFYNKGEVCSAGSRLFVQEEIHDLFMEKLVEKANGYKVGDPFDPKTRVGPLVSEEQLKKVLRYIEIGKNEKAKLLTGGERANVGNGKGYFVKPTIFDEVDNQMKIAQEEIFGPVLATLRFKDIDEVIQKANQTIYGLAAAVWTKDIKKAHLLAKELKAGTVWINTYGVFDAASPFGGYKMSGFGRELGMHALELYTQVKSVWIDLS